MGVGGLGLKPSIKVQGLGFRARGLGLLRLEVVRVPWWDPEPRQQASLCYTVVAVGNP